MTVNFLLSNTHRHNQPSGGSTGRATQQPSRHWHHPTASHPSQLAVRSVRGNLSKQCTLLKPPQVATSFNTPR
jgi:hypothetical protein